VFVLWLGDHTYVVLNNILSPRRGSPSLGLCIGTTFKKRPKQSPAALLRCPALLTGVYLGGTPVVWLDMSALGLTPRRLALRTVARPSSGLHLVVGLSASWLGLPGRRSAIRLVFGSYASSFGSLCCWSAVRVVVGLIAWVFDRPCGRSTVHVVV